MEGVVKVSDQKIKRKRFNKYFSAKDLNFNKELEIVLSPRGRGCQDAISSKRGLSSQRK